MSANSFYRFPLLPIVVLVCVACGKESDVRVYRVPKQYVSVNHIDQNGTLSTDTAMSQVPVANADPDANISWTLPQGWTAKGGTGMRLANLSVKTGSDEVSGYIISLTGNWGSPQGNINRWRKEIGLEPLSEKETLKLIKPFSPESPGKKFVFLQGDSEDDSGQLIGIVPINNRTIFVKLTGSTEVLHTILKNFKTFCLSIGEPN